MCVGETFPPFEQPHPIAEHDFGVGFHATRREEWRHQLALAPPQRTSAGDESLPCEIPAYGVIAVEFVVVLAIRDVDMANRFRVYGHDERSAQMQLERITMGFPRLVDVGEKTVLAQIPYSGEESGPWKWLRCPPSSWSIILTSSPRPAVTACNARNRSKRTNRSCRPLSATVTAPTIAMLRRSVHVAVTLGAGGPVYV